MSVKLTPTALFHTLLVSDASPRERLRVARTPLMEGLQNRVAKRMRGKAAAAWHRVQQSVRLDGYEVAAMQQGWGLFNPTRTVSASAWACGRLTPAVQSTAVATLTAALSRLGVESDVELLMVPADPANRNLMTRCHGLSVCAAAPGWVLVEIWPSDGNLDRLAAGLARAAAHQQFALSREGREAPITLADVLKVEACAAQLAASLELVHAGSLARQLFDPPADHAATLRHIAGFYGLEGYDDLDTNVYGGLDRGADTRVPPLGPAPVVTPAERAYTREAIASERETTDPVRIAACLYGDEAVRAWGHAGGGYSPLAGFEVASMDGADAAC